MTEQEILDQIPDTWADDIERMELELRAKDVWSSVIRGFAEQLGLKTTGSLDQMIARIAKKHGVSKKKERESLKQTCLQNAKIDIFIERYGHLFLRDNTGELSYSIPMLRKMTGLPLE